jgi:hypothetical protein
VRRLAATRDYGLAAVSSAGANAFFTRDGALNPVTAWRPNTFREKFSGVAHAGQWDAIKHMSFLEC